MTELSREIINTFQVRKGKRKKRAFRALVTDAFTRAGYEVNEERSKFATNLIIGDPDSAKLVITAHYDTCAIMPVPNFITPMNVGLYALYQLVLIVVMFGFAGLLMAAPVLFGWTDEFILPIFSFTLFILCGFMLFGPSNKHTANDNTSGVVTLIETALALPEGLRKNVLFVLFDNEELGLLGSSAFATMHADMRGNTPFINLDCVGDGDNIMLVLPKRVTEPLEMALRAAFTGFPQKEVIIRPAKGTFYPSDQANFALGVGVAALKRSKRGILYMDRIHTPKDTNLDERNVELISAALVETAGQLTIDN